MSAALLSRCRLISHGIGDIGAVVTKDCCLCKGVFEHAEAAEAERVKWLHWVPQFEGAIHNELQSVYHSVKVSFCLLSMAVH